MPVKKKAVSAKAAGRSRSGARLSKKPPLTPAQLKQIDAYWHAANYLTACQLYLLDNPLLERPLTAADLKQTIVGHWGTCPGQNFIYTHLDRVIKRDDLDMIYLSGPGHGGNAMVAQDWLDGSYAEVYPNITQDKDGMKKLFKRFSFPGGIPSHVAPETPGSIHEGGELGYSLAHAFGAVADNPDLIAACVVGDGEAETGPLATSWHGNKFMNPITDGAVLPILHLNGQIKLVNLKPDTYVVTEVKAPDGYVLDSTSQTVKVDRNDTQTLTFTNTPIGGGQIIKVDADSGKRIKGVQFEIAKMNGERIGTYTTDSNGVITLPQLADGWYTATEIKAAKGYLLDSMR